MTSLCTSYPEWEHKNESISHTKRFPIQHNQLEVLICYRSSKIVKMSMALIEQGDSISTPKRFSKIFFKMWFFIFRKVGKFFVTIYRWKTNWNWLVCTMYVQKICPIHSGLAHARQKNSKRIIIDLLIVQKCWRLCMLHPRLPQRVSSRMPAYRGIEGWTLIFNLHLHTKVSGKGYPENWEHFSEKSNNQC